MAEQRIVNLTELSDILGLSLPTLRDLIRKNPDFPVETRGQHGVPYEFDLDAVQAWRAEHKAAEETARAEREQELRQWRLDIFGDAEDEAAQRSRGLSPHERRAELEAQIAEDKARQLRGELLARGDVDRQLRLAFSQLQKGLRAVAPELARELALERDVRIAIDTKIRHRLNETIDHLRALMRADEDEASDAA